jgi:PAS domain S-box-containing protein
VTSTILVVDDRAADRAYLITLLGDRGYRVLEAADGVEGLAATHANRPDLVIADVVMPGIDGYEFVRRLRRDKIIAHTPVMFYTAISHGTKARSLAEACGVDRVLSKPSELKDILAAVQALLGSAGNPFVAAAHPEFEQEHIRLLTNKLFEKGKELEEANASLQASELQYRALFNQNPLPMWIVDESTFMFLAVNDAAVQHYGYSSGEFLNMSVLEIRPPEDVPAVRAEILEGRSKPLKDAGIRRHRTKDGRLIDVAIFAQHTTFEGRQARLTLAEDVTERERAQRKLRESGEQLRELAARLQSVREEERTRVARQLHDELGQALTALRMDCTWIKGKLTGADTNVIDRVQGSIHLVDETILTVRQLAADLRPGILDLGLRAAIEWQAEEFQTRSDIACVVEASSQAGPLSPEQDTEVFRIFQESLTNIARHSGASLVQVTICQAPDGLHLKVEDNGRGITEDEINRRSSLGLLGIRERVSLIGGTFSIQGRPGQGTTLRVDVPPRSAEA